MFGGDEEDRTLDLTDANRTLSQLSYAPKEHFYYITRRQVCTERSLILKKEDFRRKNQFFRHFAYSALWNWMGSVAGVRVLNWYPFSL